MKTTKETICKDQVHHRNGALRNQPLEDPEEVLDIIDGVQRRIGQDLHDSVQQELVGLSMISQTLLNQLQRKTASSAEHSLGACCELARKLVEGFTRAHEELQSISRGLVPSNGASERLVDSLRSLADRTDGLHGVCCSFQCNQEPVPSDPKVSLHLYRISQEAICNALKHSGASHIRMALDCRMGRTVLHVADNGKGFSGDLALGGLGFQSMQYRAMLIGATLEISTIPTGGTLVSCMIQESSR
jgi:signal transduction histidine kinase